MADTAQLVLIELGRIARVLADRFESPEAFVSWMAELGWDVPAPAGGLSAVAAQVGSVVDLLEQVESAGQLDEALLQQIAEEALACIAAAKDLSALFTGITLPSGFLTEAPGQIALSVFLDYLETDHPLVYAAFRLIGVITIEPMAAAGGRPAYEARSLSLDALGQLLSDPGAAFRDLYGWGRPDADLGSLRDAFQLLVHALGMPAHRQAPSAELADGLYTGLPADKKDLVWELRVPVLEAADDDIGYATAGLALLPLFDPAWASDGLALVPYAEGEFDVEIPLGKRFVLRLGAGIAGSIRIEVRYGGARVIVCQDGSDFRGQGSVELALKTAGEPTIVFGERDASRLEVGGLSAKLEVGVAGGKVDATIAFDLQDGKLVVAVGKGDGFLQKIFGDLTLESRLDLGIGWSTTDGLFFRGSAGLEVTIPIHESLGPVKLESILVGLLFDFEEGGLEVRLGITAGLEIGPFAASINRVGIKARLTQKEDGNLGPLQLGPPGFLPPTGAGLSIDAGVTGGGFLEFDEANERYAGILALKLGEIGITAIGLVTTRMPDGSKGFSLLINVGITFDPPIQLSMGFTLAGVGGLIGVNRTMMVDVLREGVKKRTLDSILFPEPEWVIPNAAKVISDLRAVFPPAEGRFVVGPMVKIGYGTPAFIVADIGIFLELFDPVRIVLLGQLAMELPDPSDVIVSIHLDIVGVLDFQKKELSFQASLYDSGILSWELVGDSAFFLSWGAEPAFAMSLGGFHPKFTPPPPPIVFAGLRRLGLNLSSGSSFQLSCGVYQALTPNSLQFGARADLYAAACGATVTGYLGFDTLIYFSPFSFSIDLAAGVQIRYQGASLADVRLALALSGPTPWNARGSAVIKILFFDIEADFDVTWGRADAATLPAVDPWPRLEEALRRPDSWGSRLPSSATMVESLGKVEEEPAVTADGEEPSQGPIIVHPAGMIEIRQNVAPLETTLEKFGNAPVRDYDRFRLLRLTTADGATFDVETVDEYFARGQFETLSSSQKLSVPSFEKMPGGVTTRSSNRMTVLGDVREQKLGYESVVINEDRTSERPLPANRDKAVASWARTRFLAAGNASRRSALRAGGAARFAHVGDGMTGTVVETYSIVQADTLAPADLDPGVDTWGKGMTRTQADRALADHLARHPEDAGVLSVVPTCEVEVAP